MTTNNDRSKLFDIKNRATNLQAGDLMIFDLKNGTLSFSRVGTDLYVHQPSLDREISLTFPWRINDSLALQIAHVVEVVTGFGLKRIDRTEDRLVFKLT